MGQAGPRHCRTGSSENHLNGSGSRWSRMQTVTAGQAAQKKAPEPRNVHSPHRQLRNWLKIAGGMHHPDSLPHRQLRNAGIVPRIGAPFTAAQAAQKRPAASRAQSTFGSLPDRQLRNPPFPYDAPVTAGHRQLRKDWRRQAARTSSPPHRQLRKATRAGRTGLRFTAGQAAQKAPQPARWRLAFTAGQAAQKVASAKPASSSQNVAHDRHCRTGSSENAETADHCREASLPDRQLRNRLALTAFQCASLPDIGSSENAAAKAVARSQRSLPHRQLRKFAKNRGYCVHRRIGSSEIHDAVAQAVPFTAG